MNPTRILAEVSREWTRPAPFVLLGVQLAVAAVFTLDPREVSDYWGVPLLLMPTLMVPVAAAVFTRDRERGAAAVVLSTPLTTGEWFLAKCTFLLQFVLAGVALTAVPALVLFSGARAPALAAHAHYFPWSFLVGVASASVGALVGVVSTRRTSVALSVAFSVVIVWFAFLEKTRELLEAADSAREARLVLFLAHLSPVQWADEATENWSRVVPAAGEPALAWGALLFVPVFLGLAALIVLRLQHVDDWHRPLRARRGGLAAVAVLLVVGGGAFASWDFVIASNAGPGDFQAEWRSPRGDLVIDYEGFWKRDVVGLEPLRVGDRAYVALDFEGAPGTRVNVTALDVESPFLGFARAGPEPPFTVTLQERRVPPGVPREALSAGIAEVNVNLTLTRVTYAGTLTPLTVSGIVDGEPFTIDAMTPLHAPDVPTVPAFLAAAVPAGLLFASARVLPWRWNKW